MEIKDIKVYIQERKKAAMIKAFCNSLPDFKTVDEGVDIVIFVISIIFYAICALYMSVGIGYTTNEWKISCKGREEHTICAMACGAPYFFLYSAILLVFAALVVGYISFKKKLVKELQEIDDKFGDGKSEVKKESKGSDSVPNESKCQ
jgi:hypothetical protein